MAAAQFALPACVAWIVQVPTAASATVAPEMAQTEGVAEAKLTARPDDAVAATVNGGVPKARFESAPKVMVWLSCVTWKLWFTGVAAAQSALPACAALIVHVPTAASVAVVPDTVHTAGVVDPKVTASPEDAVALTVNGALPNARLESAPKVMVWPPCVMRKLWFTGVAAAQLALPPCIAWIVHMPTAASATVPFDTVHKPGVVDPKVTARPEDAVALTANGALPNGRFESAPKVMAWLPWVIWKLWLTGVAAAQLALPAWVAWIVQLPADNSVTVAPDTVHTAGVVDAKLTDKPEDAVALRANGALPNGRFESAPKVIAWLSCAIWKLWLTGGAAA